MVGILRGHGHPLYLQRPRVPGPPPVQCHGRGYGRCGGSHRCRPAEPVRKTGGIFPDRAGVVDRNITRLLKELHGDDMDLLDVLETMRDPRVLETKVQRLKDRQGHTDLVDFFENELLGSMSEKYRQFVIGLRAQLEYLTGNCGTSLPAAATSILTSKRTFINDSSVGD